MKKLNWKHYIIVGIILISIELIYGLFLEMSHPGSPITIFPKEGISLTLGFIWFSALLILSYIGLPAFVIGLVFIIIGILKKKPKRRKRK